MASLEAYRCPNTLERAARPKSLRKDIGQSAAEKLDLLRRRAPAREMKLMHMMSLGVNTAGMEIRELEGLGSGSHRFQRI
jgi:hypothetical protein